MRLCMMFIFLHILTINVIAEPFPGPEKYIGYTYTFYDGGIRISKQIVLYNPFDSSYDSYELGKFGKPLRNIVPIEAKDNYGDIGYEVVEDERQYRIIVHFREPLKSHEWRKIIFTLEESAPVPEVCNIPFVDTLSKLKSKLNLPKLNLPLEIRCFPFDEYIISYDQNIPSSRAEFTKFEGKYMKIENESIMFFDMPLRQCHTFIATPGFDLINESGKCRAVCSSKVLTYMQNGTFKLPIEFKIIDLYLETRKEGEGRLRFCVEDPCKLAKLPKTNGFITIRYYRGILQKILFLVLAIMATIIVLYKHSLSSLMWFIGFYFASILALPSRPFSLTFFEVVFILLVISMFIKGVTIKAKDFNIKARLSKLGNNVLQNTKKIFEKDKQTR